MGPPYDGLSRRRRLHVVMVAQLNYSETLQIEIIKIFATALFVAGAAAIVVAWYQSRSAAAASKREREIDLDHAKRDIKSHFVGATSDLAGTFYITTQQHWRKKSDPNGWGKPDGGELDSAYGQWASKSEVIENELRVRYGWDNPPAVLWHQVRDLLRVRYFQLCDRASDELRRRNAKDFEDETHSGLTTEELASPKIVLSTYHDVMKALSWSLIHSDVVV
jgi:hypothetical protein